MLADREFIKSITEQIKQQNEQMKQQAEVQRSLLEVISQLKSGESSQGLGAPRKQSDVEFLIESLANTMTEFAYDLESKLTFENWYNRYTDLFTDDAKKLDDKAKVRLLRHTSAH